jgi:hypothetical protein
MIRMLLEITVNRIWSNGSDPRYIRCARCGAVESETDNPARVTSHMKFRDGRLVEQTTTPPEWTCRSCGRSGPLEVGEELPNDTLARCRRRWICRNVFKVPGGVTTVTCPRCYTAQPALTTGIG